MATYDADNIGFRDNFWQDSEPETLKFFFGIMLLRRQPASSATTLAHQICQWR